MAFLNGTDVPDLLRIQTLITKFVGSIFSCAANLTVGTEGPLVHMGACIASVIAFWECGEQMQHNMTVLRNLLHPLELMHYTHLLHAAYIPA